MISGIIKVEVSVISRSRRLRLITLTEILIDKPIFTVFIKQSSAEKLNAKKVSLNLYLQVISQFLAGSMKRIEKPFLLRCPRK